VSESMWQKQTLRASTARVTLAGGNCVSTVGTEVNGRDVVPARGSAKEGLNGGLNGARSDGGIHTISA
jgi:hypothetical protein